MNLKLNNKSIIFLVIMAAALGLRLWGINNPLLDFHHFRQTYTAMMAKNFYLGSMNIFFPSVDILEFNNIIEFQIYPFLVAILYKIFGFHDILGRIVSVAFSMASIYYMYKLVNRFAGEIASLISAGLLAVLPMMVFYGRTFMLESMMIFLSIFTIYMMVRWHDTDKNVYFLGSIISGIFLLLIKIATAYMLLPMAFLVFNRSGWKSFRDYKNYILLFLVILPSIYWYALHVVFFPELAQKGGMASGSVTGGYLGEGMRALTISLLSKGEFWSKIFLSRIGEYHLAYSGFFVLLAAIFMRGYHQYLVFKKGNTAERIPANMYESGKSKNIWNESREQLLFYVWLFAVFMFFIMFPAPNYAHEYYQLPVIPPAVAIISIFVASIIKSIKDQGYTLKGKLILGFFIFLTVPILISTYERLQARLTLDYKYSKFAEEIKKVTEKDDLILLWDIPRTEVFYFAERKGFTTHAIMKNDIEKIKEYKEKGAKYFVTPYAEFIVYAPEIKQYLDENSKQILGHEASSEVFKTKLTILMATKGDTASLFPGFIYEL